MIRLSKLTDYAIVLLTHMSNDAGHGQKHHAQDLSRATGVPEPTVGKIMKQLSRTALVQSHRGAQGGYVLSLPGNQITLRMVIEAMEGPIAVTECVSRAHHSKAKAPACAIAGQCPIHGNWQKVNDAVVRALDQLDLTHMSRPTGQLVTF